MTTTKRSSKTNLNHVKTVQANLARARKSIHPEVFDTYFKGELTIACLRAEVVALRKELKSLTKRKAYVGNDWEYYPYHFLSLASAVKRA